MSLRSRRRQQAQVHRELPGLQPLPVHPVAASPLEVDGMHDRAHPNINGAKCIHIAPADDGLDAAAQWIASLSTELSRTRLRSLAATSRRPRTPSATFE